MARTRSVTVGATIALGLLAAMCGERPGAKVRIQPLKAAAGKTSGMAAAAGRGTMGSSAGTGGTANGQVGAGGDQGAGEGGGSSMQTPDDNGTMNRGGTSSRGGSAGRTPTGGSGAIDGSGDTGATDASGGTAGEDATGATGGHDDGATAGDTGEPGTGGRATGGSAGQSLGGSGGLGGLAGLGGNGASAGGGAGGSGGATTSCELKTGCCAANDPVCVDGCPSDADFCCNVSIGARMPCNASTVFDAVVCLDCSGQSFGTQPCSTSCVVATDAPCSDATWDDVCSTGGFAYCSDATAGYRAGCYSSDGAGPFHSYISCTCDPDS